jgi:hypothetical protein
MSNYNPHDDAADIYFNNPQKLTEFQAKRAARIARLAEELYARLPEQCWMTENHLAKLLGIPRRQLRLAKKELVERGLITVEARQNGRRANPAHGIRKVNPIIPIISDGPSTGGVDWGLLEEVTAKDLNEWPVTDQVEFYYRMGLKVIPIHRPELKRGAVYCSCRLGGRCHSIGKHPVVQWKGLDLSDPTTRREMCAYWRDGGARFNVGLVVDHFAVIDVDFQHGGHLSLGLLQEELGELSAALSVTSGNGRHIYVNDGGLLACVSNAQGCPGLDVKAKGGVIVAPRSTHASGNEYRWETVGAPEQLPESWGYFLRGGGGPTRTKFRAMGKVALPAELEVGYVIPKGARNYTLFRLACRERGRGSNEMDILIKLETINAKHCEPPLPQSELPYIAKNAAKYATEAEKRMRTKG